MSFVKDLQQHPDVRTFVGTDKDDFIFGSDSTPEVLIGGKGNDNIRAGGGYDVILGGPGNDHLSNDNKFGHPTDPLMGDKYGARSYGGAGDDVMEVGFSQNSKGKDMPWYLNGDGNATGNERDNDVRGSDMFVFHNSPRQQTGTPTHIASFDDKPGLHDRIHPVGDFHVYGIKTTDMRGDAFLLHSVYGRDDGGNKVKISLAEDHGTRVVLHTADGSYSHEARVDAMQHHIDDVWLF